MKTTEEKNKYHKEWSEKNRERSREIARAWRWRNVEKMKEYAKKFNQKPEVKEYYRKYRRLEKEKRALAEFARKVISSAIKKGDLPKPSELYCFDCNQPAKEYHHQNHNKPLEVYPLCVKCHRKIERRYPRSR